MERSLLWTRCSLRDEAGSSQNYTTGCTGRSTRLICWCFFRRSMTGLRYQAHTQIQNTDLKWKMQKCDILSISIMLFIWKHLYNRLTISSSYIFCAYVTQCKSNENDFINTFTLWQITYSDNTVQIVILITKNHNLRIPGSARDLCS